MHTHKYVYLVLATLLVGIVIGGYLGSVQESLKTSVIFSSPSSSQEDDLPPADQEFEKEMEWLNSYSVTPEKVLK